MSNTLKLGNGKWATGKDTLLSFSDTNNNYKPLPFSFSRNSSATVVNKEGLIETVGSGEPRIDFKDNTKGALLLEPQRSNAITNSETFGSTGWSFVTTGTAIAPIVTNNYATSPDGTQNAQRIQFNLGGGSPSRTVIRQNITSQTDWIVSVWMKSTNGAEQKILWHTTSDTNETIVTGEWKRFTFSRNGLNNSWVGLCLNGGVSSVDTADILVYGFQAEQGSYATSYIPTSGSAVTRVGESTSQTVPDGVIGQTEGTLFLDFKILTEDEINCNIFNTNKNTTNAIAVIRTKSSKLLQVQTFFNSVNANYSSTNTYNVGDRIKLAFKYKNGNVKLYINGILENSATPTFTISSSLSEINLADNVTYFARKEGVDYTSLQLYDTALTDQELIALTS